MRSGAARSNFHSGLAMIAVAGVQRGSVRADPNASVLLDSLSITDILDETPNTCSFACRGFIPSPGDDVVITLGSINNLDRIFGGQVISVDQGYLLKPANAVYHAHAVDYTWGLNKRKVIKRYLSMTYAAIWADLITSYAAGYTYAVQTGLGSIDEITFTNEDLPTCLTRLAKRGGFYWNCDYHKVVRLFLTDTSGTNPTTLTVDHQSFAESVITRDLSQVITRVYVEGGGVVALTECAVGETIIPVTDTAWYNVDGGTVVSGPQRITYTAAMPGGDGAVVGHGVTPTAAPNATIVAGSGLTLGAHALAYTWVTAAGETLPSPIANVTAATITAPTVAPTQIALSSPTYDWYGTPAFPVYFAIGDTVVYTYTYSAASSPGDLTTETTQSPPLSFVAQVSPVRGAPWMVNHYNFFIYSPDPNVKWVHVWRAVNGAAARFCTSFANAPVEMILQDNSNSSAVALPSPNPTIAQVDLKGIAAGPPGTTARNVYMTVANGLALKLQSTIANNTATSTTVATADGSLGALAPTSDTSGLVGTSLGQASAFYTTVTGFSVSGTATNATSSAPVFSSGSYNFVAADVGAYIYIKAGTNWTVGRYLIVSVAANAATITGPCATVPSPTVGTWGIDYSGLADPRIVFTDLAIDAATNTNFTSAANPVGYNFVGNTITITNGVGFNLQRVIVVSVSGTAGTADRSLGTLGSTGGVGTLGGAQAASSVLTGANSLLMTGTAAFSTTGGWVISGSQLIRYTGINLNSLIGIPPTGIGSIQASITYGSTITAAPALSGIPASGAGSILITILKGDEVNLLVIVNDTGAQDALAELLSGAEQRPNVLTVTPSAGVGIEAGIHQWAYTFGTASADGIVSPLTSRALVLAVTAPTYTPVHSIDHATAGNPTGAFVIGDSVEWVFTYSAAASATDFTQESGSSPSTGASTVAAWVGGAPFPDLQKIQIQHTTDPTVKWIHLWRRVNGGPYRLVQLGGTAARANNGTTSTEIDTDPNNASGIYLTEIPTPVMNMCQAALSQIARGPAGTINRKLYRTVAGGSQLKFLVTLPDNVTNTYLDTIPDAALGANGPTFTLSDDGIIEEYIQDRRIGATEALARGAAVLRLRGTVEALLRYRSRDQNTRAGRMQPAVLPAPTSLVADFKIQQVTMSQFTDALHPRQFPTYVAEASTTKFSFEDLLRVARKGAA